VSGLTIGLVGDRRTSVVAHQAIPEAIRLAADEARLRVDVEWIGTETISAPSRDLRHCSGIWCVPGSPYRSTAGAIAAIRFAREGRIPFLGTCAGFQHALLEVAESLWNVDTAGHAELDPDVEDPIISLLDCPLVEEGGRVHFLGGSRLAGAYGQPSAEEEYHCSYGFNARYREHLEAGPLRLTAWNDDGDVRGVELDGHPFFVATLFQPERAGLRGVTPPIVRAFLAAAAS